MTVTASVQSQGWKSWSPKPPSKFSKVPSSILLFCQTWAAFTSSRKGLVAHAPCFGYERGSSHEKKKKKEIRGKRPLILEQSFKERWHILSRTESLHISVMTPDTLNCKILLKNLYSSSLSHSFFYYLSLSLFRNKGNVLKCERKGS